MAELDGSPLDAASEHAGVVKLTDDPKRKKELLCYWKMSEHAAIYSILPWALMRPSAFNASQYTIFQINKTTENSYFVLKVALFTLIIYNHYVVQVQTNTACLQLF